MPVLRFETKQVQDVVRANGAATCICFASSMVRRSISLGNFISGSGVSLLPHSEAVMLSQYVNT